MREACKHPALLDEMSIVDIFTKLIFDADAKLDEGEAAVLRLLLKIEPALGGQPRMLISEYLCSMGVDEMIDMVGHIKQLLDFQQGLGATPRARRAPRVHH